MSAMQHSQFNVSSSPFPEYLLIAEVNSCMDHVLADTPCIREAFKKNIESMSMLIPPSDPQTPRLRLFFVCDVFLVYWG